MDNESIEKCFSSRRRVISKKPYQKKNSLDIEKDMRNASLRLSASSLTLSSNT